MRGFVLYFVVLHSQIFMQQNILGAMKFERKRSKMLMVAGNVLFKNAGTDRVNLAPKYLIPFIFEPTPHTFFRAKEAVCPPRTSFTGILLRWMDLTVMERKAPKGSGPRSKVSLSRISPRNVVPDTTVPTPWTKKIGLLREGTHKYINWDRQHAYGYWIGVVYLELGRLVVFEWAPGGEQVQEHLQQVHVFSCDVRDLEDGTYSTKQTNICKSGE